MQILVSSGNIDWHGAPKPDIAIAHNPLTGFSLLRNGAAFLGGAATLEDLLNLYETKPDASPDLLEEMIELLLHLRPELA